MTPNQITMVRIALAFWAVGLFGRSLWADGAALVLTISAIGLDALDGYVARRRKLSTPLGAQLDILGDRVVENLFFTFFAVAGLVSLWVPVLFFLRGTLTDFLRGLAARAGRSGFGKDSMLESWWGRQFVASRASRATYAALKCVCFCALGFELTLLHLPPGQAASDGLGWVPWCVRCLVVVTVVFCVVRAVPVVWEGRRYIVQLAPEVSQIAGAAR